LNKLKISFNNKDLSSIKIKNANMDFSLCNHASFENANLENVSFIGA
jgi:uncharacterized protein YjbI with pentapeptide repeats